MIILIKFSQNTNVVFVIASTLSIISYLRFEKFRKAIDNGLYTGILLTDLSKAFDCLSYDLLIAKLNACGFSNNALKFISPVFKPMGLKADF